MVMTRFVGRGDAFNKDEPPSELLVATVASALIPLRPLALDSPSSQLLTRDVKAVAGRKALALVIAITRCDLEVLLNEN